MTAVEFLLRELRIEDLAKGEQLSVVLEICKQAKEMEKKQIIEAVESTINSVKLDDKKEGFICMNGEGYYKQTFNK